MNQTDFIGLNNFEVTLTKFGVTSAFVLHIKFFDLQLRRLELITEIKQQIRASILKEKGSDYIVSPEA